MPKSKWPEIQEKLTLIEGWSRNGLTEEQIIKNLGISKDTFYRYKNKYPDLSDALKKGKEQADIEVENALFKEAIGYYFTEETVDRQGGVVKVQKFARPNATAQIFWLKNRKSQDWRDRQELDHRGNVGVTHNPMEQLSAEELKKLANMADD